MTIPEATGERLESWAPSGADPVELRIPADATFLRLARYAAADAAARGGLDLDAVDDVRLAVSELCGLLTGSGVTITLRFDVGERGIVVDGHGAPGPGMQGENGELARVLVEAVVDDLAIDERDDGVAFHFEKRAKV